MAGTGLLIVALLLFGTTILDTIKKTVATAVIRGLTRAALGVMLVPLYFLALSEVKNIGVHIYFSLAMILLALGTVYSFGNAIKRYQAKKITPQV